MPVYVLVLLKQMTAGGRPKQKKLISSSSEVWECKTEVKAHLVSAASSYWFAVSL